MQPEIRKASDVDEYATAERCRIREISNDAADPAVSIARARVAPDTTTAWHRLTATAERYLIVAGEGRMELGEHAPEHVGPGDVVRIPPGVAQRIANTGTADLVFYAICSPRFRPECYEALE